MRNALSKRKYGSGTRNYMKIHITYGPGHRLYSSFIENAPISSLLCVTEVCQINSSAEPSHYPRMQIRSTQGCNYAYRFLKKCNGSGAMGENCNDPVILFLKHKRNKSCKKVSIRVDKSLIYALSPVRT